MVRPNYKDFRRGTLGIHHSAKGSEWENHMYVKKIDGVYYYPVGYEDGRTINSLKEKDSDSVGNNKKSIDMVKNHFDQYLAKRGIDWRTLPKDQVDQMQRDILKQIENGKEEDQVPEKTVDELAKEVIRGTFGDGQDRKNLLGDSYIEVQKRVNELMKGSTGSKKVLEASEESVKKAEEAAKKASTSTSDSNVHSGVDIDEVLNVYKKKSRR